MHLDDTDPWALAFNNHLCRANQLQAVKVPDVLPRTSVQTSSGPRLERSSHDHMSMTAGDFCEIYQRPRRRNNFDALVSCFFLDTAPNIISYIETVAQCLKPGGILSLIHI